MKHIEIIFCFCIVILSSLSSISAAPDKNFFDIRFPDDHEDRDDWDLDSHLFFDDDDDDDFFENIKTLAIVIFCAFSLICLSVLACCCLCPICCLYKRRRRGRVLSQGAAVNQAPTQQDYNHQHQSPQPTYSGQSPYPVQNSSQVHSQPGYPPHSTHSGQPSYQMQPQGPAYSKPQEPYNPSYSANSNPNFPQMEHPASQGVFVHPEPPPPYPGLP